MESKNLKIFIQLAPFQGLTDSVYRNTFVRVFGGVDEAFAPYIANIGTAKVHPSKIKDVLPSENPYIRTIPQILSNSAGEIRSLAKVLAGEGIDELNWNIGCPFPQVTRKRRGSGLLPFPDTIREILEEAIPGLPVQLSVKMRAGMHSFDEIRAVLEVLENFPLKEVIIHPRTASQLYKGQANPDVVSGCLSEFIHQVSYNGDIVNSAVFHSLRTKLPTINHWMIGRGALMDPTLPSRLRDKRTWNEDDRRQALQLFTEEIVFREFSRNRNEPSVLSRMKSIWIYLSHSFINQHAVFRNLRKCLTLEDFRLSVRNILHNEALLPELKGIIGENWKGNEV